MTFLARPLVFLVGRVGGCPTPEIPFPLAFFNALLDDDPTLEPSAGLCMILQSHWTLIVAATAVFSYGAMIAFAYPIGRERRARLSCLFYESPPHHGWRALRRGLIVCSPYLLVLIVVGAIELSKPGQVSVQFLSYAAISSAAFLATIGWLFTAFQNEKAARKQHSLNVLMQMRHSREYQRHVDNRRCQEADWRNIRGLDEAREIYAAGARPADPESPVTYYSTIIYLLNYFEYIAGAVRNGDLDEKFIKASLHSVIFDYYTAFLPLICVLDGLDTVYETARREADAGYRALPRKVKSHTPHSADLYWLVDRWKIHRRKTAKEVPIQLQPFKLNSVDAAHVAISQGAATFLMRQLDRLAPLRMRLSRTN